MSKNFKISPFWTRFYQSTLSSCAKKTKIGNFKRNFLRFRHFKSISHFLFIIQIAWNSLRHSRKWLIFSQRSRTPGNRKMRHTNEWKRATDSTGSFPKSEIDSSEACKKKIEKFCQNRTRKMHLRVAIQKDTPFQYGALSRNASIIYHYPDFYGLFMSKEKGA